MVNVSRTWLITMAVVIAIGFLLLGGIMVGVPAVIGALSGAATRPAPPTALPTSTPIPTPAPCSLEAYGLPGVAFDGAMVDVTINGAQAKALCKDGTMGIQSLTLQPQGCWVDMANNISINNGDPWKMSNGQNVTCQNGTLKAVGGPVVAQPTPTAPPAGCTWDGFTFMNNDTWNINGQNSICQNGGWKPQAAFPAAPTATLAAAVAPGTGYCALPDPDGYGAPGGWMHPGTKVSPQSNYTCDGNLTGRWIDP